MIRARNEEDRCTAPRCELARWEGREFCQEHALLLDRCSYKENPDQPGSCGKLREAATPYCPKHNVMVAGHRGDIERRMEKLRRAKERKKVQRDMLPESPLRAYNPNADLKRRATYSE